MAKKFLRRYVLRVQTLTGETLQIETPLSVDFNISRQNLVAPNTGNFTIYNLGSVNRAKIYKDVFDTETFLAVEFWAGYGYGGDSSFLARCFYGGIKQAYSYRDGGNFKTVIEASDGLVAASTGFISQTFSKNQTQKDIIQQIISTMPTIGNTTIGNSFDDSPVRPVVLFGNQFEILDLMTEKKFYVDSQDAYVLDKQEIVSGFINTIDDQVGILDTPKKSQSWVEVGVLFEPRFVPSQGVELQSKVMPIYNGLYKITGISHSGMISDSVAGTCKTQLTLTNENILTLVKSNNQAIIEGP